MGTTIRVPRGATTTLTHTFLVDETGTDSTTQVTVSLTDANGDTVPGGGNATALNNGRYSFAWPVQAQLSLVTLGWTGTIAGALLTEFDTVEVCGGYLFSLAEARNSDSVLRDTKLYPTDRLKEFRQRVEEEVEWICDRAFTPRYRRVVLDGIGGSDLQLPDGVDDVVAGVTLRGVRTIRSAKMAPRAGQTFVPFTAGELAALVVTAGGALRRADGRAWTEGDQNVILEYEYGNDFTPEDLKDQMLARLRYRLGLTKSGVPDRAVSYTAPEGGGTYRLSLPDAYRTGVPDIDAIYARYSRRVSSQAAASNGRAVPASGTLTFRPQRDSMFHRGRM